MGRTVAGATIVETPDGSTFDWSGASRRTTDVILSADGKTFIGGNTVNIDGEPITSGGVILSGRSIAISGGTHSSGVGVEVHPNSELSTHDANGSIDIVSDQDARIRGRIAAGGEVVNGVVSLFDGHSTLTITAADQVLISREVAAGKSVTITAGDDPVDASDDLSGMSVVIAGSGLLRTGRENSTIDVSGPDQITLLAPVDL